MVGYRSTLVIVGSAFAIAAGLAAPAVANGTSVDAQDDRVTRQTYVRHDMGTDAAIQVCNSIVPADYGNRTVNNEPFSVVSPTNPDLVVSGWNDYCSDWMGLGFSTTGGEAWTSSLVPGYPADTSAEGMKSPEFIRTNTASDPVGAFNRAGTKFFVGAISFNGFAGPKTNADVWVARYAVRPTTDPMYSKYPLDYLGTTRVGQGPSAANFKGRFNDKEMIEVDRTGGANDGNVYLCWTKFPANGESTIYFSRSTNGGLTFSKGIAVSGRNAGQGCDIAVESDGDVYLLWRDFELTSSKKNFGISEVRSGDGGATFGKVQKISDLTSYNPFDTARDCGDGADLCPSGYVFHRVPLEPRITSDPTGELPGVYAVVHASDPATVVPAEGSYTSAGPGAVGQSVVLLFRSLDNGATWSGPVAVAPSNIGHQFFPDADALAGRLVVMWQDSRDDACYSVQRPMENTAAATVCNDADGGVNTYAAVSADGSTFSSPLRVSSKGQMTQFEMFGSANVPFLGDYNWVQLVERADGSLFGYLTWTDNRDVVAGPDPRETTQDGFDVFSNWQLQPDGTYTRDFNLGGYDQNIYGNSITVP